MVAWKVRSATAGTTFCDTFSKSRAGSDAVPDSAASICQSSFARPTGTAMSQPSSRASPGARLTWRASRPGSAWPAPATRADSMAWMLRCEALRSVKPARKRSPSRTSGGSPESSIRSWVERNEALPVPNQPAPPLATATMRKLVSESLSGISTLALPSMSSATRAFHSSSVSKSSRAEPRPPPPPAATALRPKWRLPITCICAVEVSTSSPRRVIIASRSFQESFGSSSSRPSSTAAIATSLPAGGAVPSARRTAIATVAFSRTR